MQRRGTAVVATGMVILAVFALGVFLLPFAFPTPPPIITRFSGTQLFSPNGDGARDRAMFSVRVREPGTLSLIVADPSGAVVRTIADHRPTSRGWLRIPWRGRGDDGAVLPDGDYAVRLRASAPGGKVFSASRRVQIDTTAPRVSGFSVASALRPGQGDVACRTAAALADEGTVTLSARPAAAGDETSPVAALGPRPAKPSQAILWPWEGRSSSGAPAPAGLYLVRLEARDPAQNTVRETRTCWVGHITGRASAAIPRRPVRVALFADGRALPPSTRVRMRLYDRLGAPGAGPSVLGRPVARPVTGRLGRARLRIPATVDPAAVWLVATTPAGSALIALETP